MEEYEKKMKTLSYKLLLIILKSLNLYEEEIKWANTVKGSESNALQLNYISNLAPDLTSSATTILLVMLMDSVA